jgi:hypothetical protein
MAVSIEHSSSQQLNCRGIRLVRRVLVPRASPSVRSTECLRVSNAVSSANIRCSADPAAMRLSREHYGIIGRC